MTDNRTLADIARGNESSPPPLAVAASALEAAVDKALAHTLSRHRVAPNTRRGYRADVKDWLAYARRHGLTDAPVSTDDAAQYLSSLVRRGLKLATLRRRAAAINALNREANGAPLDSLRISQLLSNIAKERGSHVAKKLPLTEGLVLRIVRSIDPVGVGLRDRALFLVGTMAGMRRAELAALTWADVQEVREGVKLLIRRSKTDQEGKGRFALLLYAENGTGPAEALAQWRAESQGVDGSVFRIGGRTIARLVKKHVQRVGLEAGGYSGHSFRAGFCTIAKSLGATTEEYAEQTGHRNLQVAADYAHDIDRARNRAVRLVAAALTIPEDT